MHHLAFPLLLQAVEQLFIGHNDQEPRNLARAEALRAFRAHADETNDIFHLAAQVIAGTILRAEALLGSDAAQGASLTRPSIYPRRGALVQACICQTALWHKFIATWPAQECQEAEMHALGWQGGGHCEACMEGLPIFFAAHAATNGHADGGRACWAALQRAWRPFAAAWKAPWWECVAVPEDVSDGAAFRQGASSSYHMALVGCTLHTHPWCVNSPETSEVLADFQGTVATSACRAWHQGQGRSACA